ncbi:MAG: S8 family serine peptidase [Algicola sp.]|nr:S8 family serine peptidase [Algicola sp.]
MIDPQKMAQLKQQRSVRAVVPFLPIYKLQEGLEQRIAIHKDQPDETQINYSVLSVNKNHSAKLQQFVESLGGSVLAADKGTIGSRFSANLNTRQLLKVAQNSATLFIDELGDAQGEDIDDVKEPGGYNWLETVEGYAGQGVDPKYQGILHKASRPIVFSRYSGFSTAQPDASNLRGHLAQLVDPNGPYRAVVQTSSTDYAKTLDYTTWSADVDEVLFDSDLLKTQSQSNAGSQMSRPGAWSKNMVAVGGIKTYSTLSRSDDGWGNGASIGPASDDRIKPDLSGQYDNFDMIADGGGYNSRGGTSFSTPAVAGAFGIFFQMWADGVFDGGPGKQGAPEFRDVFDVRPHATTAKAMIIHSAFQYDFSGGDSDNLSRYGV